MVHPNSHRVSRVPWYLGTSLESRSPFVYGAVTRYGGPFQEPSTKRTICNSLIPLQRDRAIPHDPRRTTLAGLAPVWFGLIRVRSPLLTESHLLSLPGGTEMVHFPPLAFTKLCVHSGMAEHDLRRVLPFGNPRINACLRLPEAYRSWPRPSSPLCAKASTVHP